MLLVNLSACAASHRGHDAGLLGVPGCEPPTSAGERKTPSVAPEAAPASIARARCPAGSRTRPRVAGLAIIERVSAVLAGISGRRYQVAPIGRAARPVSAAAPDAVVLTHVGERATSVRAVAQSGSLSPPHPDGEDTDSEFRWCRCVERKNFRRDLAASTGRRQPAPVWLDRTPLMHEHPARSSDRVTVRPLVIGRLPRVERARPRN